MRIQSFTDLIAWRKAHLLVLETYKVVDKFPKNELYGLTSQIKRSAISIVSNIAEGFSRKSLKEKIQFYYIALGSLTEYQSQLLLARDLLFIDKEDFTKLSFKTIEISKLINSLIKNLNT